MLTALLLCLTVAACMPTTPPEPGALSDSERAACIADGGAPTRGLGDETCARPTPDAGQSCTTGTQCSAGLCFADKASNSDGYCAPLDANFGCHDILEDGTPVTICID